MPVFAQEAREGELQGEDPEAGGVQVLNQVLTGCGGAKGGKEGGRKLKDDGRWLFNSV